MSFIIYIEINKYYREIRETILINVRIIYKNYAIFRIFHNITTKNWQSKLYHISL